MSQDLVNAASSTGTLAKGKTCPKASLTASITMHVSVVIDQSWSVTAIFYFFSLLDLKTARGNAAH